MKCNPVFYWNYETNAEVIINQGGTGSSKTYSILQVLFLKAIEHAGSVITVAGQDIPNLKRGAIRDAKTIVSNTPEIAQHIVGYNGTDKIYNFKNGSIIEASESTVTLISLS